MSMAARAIVEGFRIGCLNAAKEIEKQMKKEKKRGGSRHCWKKRGGGKAKKVYKKVMKGKIERDDKK